MGRPCFFFPFKKQAEIYCRLHRQTAKSIERAEHGDDGSLIIAGRTSEKAPFRVDAFSVAPVNIAACAVTHDRLPWFAFPLGDIDGLSIVVGVECNCSFRIWDFKVRDYDRRCALDGKEFAD